MSTSKLTNAERQELEELRALKQAQDSGLLVKRTEKGGVYIKHTSFVEYSTAKSKNYVAGINLGAKTAKALFGNPELLAQVVKSVNSL